MYIVKIIGSFEDAYILCVHPFIICLSGTETELEVVSVFCNLN